ncbi:ComEC/Rec2 family competence protein [Sphingobium fluviale]|uniref:MBL fold metallo-hydrolase n=1 Tax=Sphingobium fluviale TaxID=2506423 RepID=A0A4Q1KEI4_9SPHN|nr:hypothetical protein [Sphingobium fluviale]RXR27593.1 hypothetical protein EQG66_12010 [Sphingobium fluviale]
MPFDPQFDDFISSEKCKAYFASDGGEKVKGKTGGFHLLWGDGVKFVDGQTFGSRRKIKARGQVGWVEQSDLGGEPLLELYFIDVGQGDGVLIRTPDFRHIMLDGGYPRKSQPTGKSAADFVDWKFNKDYGHNTIVLDEMISSHIDFDHYGGLADLLAITPDTSDDMDCTAITVENFYHSGLSHWLAHSGTGAGLGPTKASSGKKWFTRLLSDRQSAIAATTNNGPQAKGEWGKFVRLMTETRNATGQPSAINRVSQNTNWLANYPQGSITAIRVLGPIEGTVSGSPALLRLDSSQSINTNGTSVLLRIDYKKSRILLTGDLNQKAHHALLELHQGEEEEFACDVGKCCHHGSEDVSMEFLGHMKAACTVISSGDHEGHDHPRPRIVAASGLTGYRTIKEDKIVTPLVYSTELARSVEIGKPEAVKAGVGASSRTFAAKQLDEVQVSYKKVASGALRGSNEKASLDVAMLVHKVLYGLVNVRTNGSKILTATMNEGDRSFAVKTFTSRF